MVRTFSRVSFSLLRICTSFLCVLRLSWSYLQVSVKLANLPFKWAVFSLPCIWLAPLSAKQKDKALTINLQSQNNQSKSSFTKRMAVSTIICPKTLHSLLPILTYSSRFYCRIFPHLPANSPTTKYKIRMIFLGSWVLTLSSSLIHICSFSASWSEFSL